ncbi:ethanolamine-phosphate phospho-lyase-like isoform X2 [Watersipora subatra]|uniref:ethanolamine-phosphate phospho-lyase-like isoform X2 n=1 Tax=Watersipora subatra TaxID=2589382 RepID=UPI00355BD774
MERNFGKTAGAGRLLPKEVPKENGILKELHDDEKESSRTQFSKEEILKIRQENYGPSCMLFFQENPLKIDRAFGQYMYDEQGTQYIDCINNVAHVGHSHPRVTQAATAQMEKLSTNNRYLHDNLPALAKRIIATLPAALSVCYFTNSGSEANDLALQLARMYKHRTDIITLDNAYHGTVTSLQEINPYKWKQTDSNTSEMYKRSSVHVVPAADTYRGEYRDDKYPPEQLTDLYVQKVKDVIDSLQNQGKAPPAAFIAESMQSCGGQVIYPDDYLPKVKRVMESCGGLTIVDEVQVGFGRVGDHWWAFQQFGEGFVPDIVTMGKPMGNGHPIAAVVTTREVADQFKLPYFNTYGGNPVSCAIGLAVMDIIEEEGLRAKAIEVGNHIVGKFEELASRHKLIGQVRGRGLFVGVDLVTNRESREPATSAAAYIVKRLRNDGVLLSRDGPDENVLKFKPPMCLTAADVDEVVAKVDKLLYELESSIPTKD